MNIMCIGHCCKWHVHLQALLANEIEEVENPEDATAPSMNMYSMFIETEGTTHKSISQQDKDKVMDPMDLDFSFDDVDFWMALPCIHRCVCQVGWRLRSRHLGS